MRHAIDDVLDACRGAATRARLLAVVGRGPLDDEIRRGHLVAPFPRAYVRPWTLDDVPVLERAAVLSVGPPAALSHISALRRWTLRALASPVVHVTVPVGRHPIGRIPGLRVHRTRVPTRVRSVDGVLTVVPEIAVVRSWPLLAEGDARAAAITAYRRRLVTADRLRSALDHAVGMRGRARLRRLVDLLEAGCESELEIWGLVGVFDHPGLRHAVRQHWVQVHGRWYRLDVAYLAERVAVELDGAATHAGREERERDMRRDAALASVDWLTLRYSYDRLMGDADGCRRDTLAALRARRSRTVRGDAAG